MSRIPGERPLTFGADAAPGFDLEVVGQGPTETARLFAQMRPLVSGVTVEYDEQMASRLEVLLHPIPETLPGQPVDWRSVLDNKAIQEGNVFELYMGYGGTRTFMGRFEIVRWLPKLGADGPQPITLKAYDGRHKMMNSNKERVKGTRKQRKHVYRNLADESIVEQVADKYGFGAQVDATDDLSRTETSTVNGKTVTRKVLPTRIQDVSTSDWAFLQKLASIHRYDLWCEWSRPNRQWVVYFKRPQDAGNQAIYHFRYASGDGSLIEAEPDFAIGDQPTDVEVLYYDRKTRDLARTVIEERDLAEDVSVDGARGGGSALQARRELSTGASVRFRAFGQTLEAFSDRPFRSRTEAQGFVRRWLSERERDFLILEGKVVGLPDLRPLQIHLLTGMSARMDGFYRFTFVKHPMQADGDNYEVEFKAHKVLSQDVIRRPVTTKAKGK